MFKLIGNLESLGWYGPKLIKNCLWGDDVTGPRFPGSWLIRSSNTTFSFSFSTDVIFCATFLELIKKFVALSFIVLITWILSKIKKIGFGYGSILYYQHLT